MTTTLHIDFTIPWLTAGGWLYVGLLYLLGGQVTLITWAFLISRAEKMHRIARSHGHPGKEPRTDLRWWACFALWPAFWPIIPRYFKTGGRP